MAEAPAGGRTVRFASAPAQLVPANPGWKRPRARMHQNTSDPIVWWSWQLAFHQPDWLRGTHPPDVSSAMHWYPLVTFWQVVADLALATAVPPGHGHTLKARRDAGLIVAQTRQGSRGSLVGKGELAHRRRAHRPVAITCLLLIAAAEGSGGMSEALISAFNGAEQG